MTEATCCLLVVGNLEDYFSRVFMRAGATSTRSGLLRQTVKEDPTRVVWTFLGLSRQCNSLALLYVAEPFEEVID